MKEPRKIVKSLDKTLNAMHCVTLKDGTKGMVIDWEVRIAVVDVNGKGKVLSTTSEIKTVER